MNTALGVHNTKAQAMSPRCNVGLRFVVLLHSAFSYPTGDVVLHAETVALPEWLTKRELQERGDRTFYDGEWYFMPDQDGNEMGPFRHSLLYAIR